MGSYGQLMLCMVRLTQNQNQLINSTLYYGHVVKTIVLCYSLSNFHTICDTMSQFNDGFKNIKKPFQCQNLPLLKLLENARTAIKYCYHREKRKSNKSDISSFEEHLQVKSSILLMNQQFNVMFQLSKNTFVDYGKIKTLTNKFWKEYSMYLSWNQFCVQFQFLKKLKHTVLFSHLCLFQNALTDLLTPGVYVLTNNEKCYFE